MTGEGVRRIIHIDTDTFYVSVEQRDPSLKGRPAGRGRLAGVSIQALAHLSGRQAATGMGRQCRQAGV